MDMTADIVAVLPEGILVIGAVACLMLGSWTPRSRQARVRATAAATTVVMLAFAVAGLVREPTTAFSGTVAIDELTGVLRLVVGGSLLVLLLLAGGEVRGHPRESELAVLLLLGGAGVLLLGAATDTAVLVVAFLLASIPLYGMVGLSTDPRAPEAAMKTYLIGALCGILMLLGASVLYGLAGTTAYAGLDALASAPAAGAAAGVALLAVGLMFKAGAVPAHFWVPDATQGTWITTASFLTTVPKLGAVLAVVRLLQALPPDRVWVLLVAAVAAVTMTVGNLAALTQHDVRRLLAWSTISQVGYLLAIAAAVPGSDLALPTLVLFLAGYAATNLGAFAVLATDPGRTEIDDWRGVGRRRPGVVAALAVLLLGLVGTPPTAVFVAKALTLTATWEAGLAWLAVLVAANTVLSLAYYLRWLTACLRRPDVPRTGEDRASTQATRVAVVCAAVAIGLGIGAAPVLGLVG
ncbi:hypothetical protein KUV85_07025 [Nocardioides panacisoli]|uniref:NADH-quinone oxidoreductase subunit N n=1 Tax=Nocardioides panacisoli TaxID=627624 RepID=UPI001C625D5E|nr:proton-conducting transporter membrane subunit [Nocardioides panacisoli]QYJ05426.1 hypothetical protein KUV85_07025 [Nocardioides panacisoli]